MLLDVATDSDDDSLRMSLLLYEEDVDLYNGTMNDEDDSNCSVVDKDELF